MDGGDGAGDGSFDACECIYSHQAGMQRLISYLRQAQSDCTDSECFNETPGSRDSAQASDPSNYTGVLLMFTWLMVALVLYFLRPAALRRGNQGKGNNDRNRKKRRHLLSPLSLRRESHRDEDHMPPAPPVM